MPAYRSEAEAEIREAVVAELRRQVKDCRIMHEVNAGVWAGNRIDVLAVGPERIAAVEIKSEKDKLERLPDQIAAMQRVAHFVVAALHDKFLVPRTERSTPDGSFYPPEEARGAVTWAYPRRDRRGHVECREEWWLHDRWAPPSLCPPHGALNMLWREELRAVCAAHRVPAGSRATRPEMMDLIRWHMTGAEVTRAICGALRTRICVEADPAMEAAV